MSKTLDKYKKTWKNQPEVDEKVSKVDIYKIAQLKSSSIVKWILIIGVLELTFWTALNFMIPESFMVVYKEFNLMGYLKFFTVLHYVIIVAFLFLFYKNYSSVSIIDSTRTLMNKILKVRKTVKYYVYYNLINLVVSSVAVNTVLFSHPDKFLKLMNPKQAEVDASQLLTTALVAQIITLVVMFFILYFFYKSTYGRLLKKLNINYKELDRLENLN